MIATTEFDINAAKRCKDLLLRALQEADATVSGQKNFRCPFHPDRSPSAGIYQRDGVWSFKCHSGRGCPSGTVFDIVSHTHGCTFPEAVAIVNDLAGGTVIANHTNGNGRRANNGKDAMPKSRAFESLERAVAHIESQLQMLSVERYQYHDGFYVVRFQDDDRKSFRPFSLWDDGWRARDPEGFLPLYNLPALLADLDSIIFVFEGERCANLATRIGLLATCSAHGSESAYCSDWSILADRRIAIVPDCDEAGQSYANAVVSLLHELTLSTRCKILNLLNLADGEDLVQFCERLSDDVDAAGLLMEAWDQATEIVRMDDSVQETPVRRGEAPPHDDFTEVTLAERLVAEHGANLRFAHGIGWRFFNGQHWEQDTLGIVGTKTKECIRQRYADLGSIEDDDARKKAFGSLRHLKSARHIEGIMKCASWEQRIRVNAGEFDNNPLMLNVRNGTVNLETGTLQPHNSDDLITKACPDNFDVNAPARLWENCLQTWLPDDGVRAFVQRITGYLATGCTDEQCLFLLYGVGANGKSVLTRTIHRALGTYCATAATDSFLAKRSGDSGRHDIARLAGARCVLASEIEEGRRLNEPLVKSVTGEDSIIARHLYQGFFEFNPQFKIVMSVNHKPTIRGQDYAIWRRIRLVPFDVTIPEGERDPKMFERLRDEGPGILTWIVNGARMWLDGGLAPPAGVMVATETYRDEQDLVGQFLDDACDVGPGKRTPFGELFKAFSRWCEDGNERKPSKQSFALRLDDHNILCERVGGRVYRLGVAPSPQIGASG